MVNNTLLSILIKVIQSQVYCSQNSEICYIGNYLYGMCTSKPVLILHRDLMVESRETNIFILHRVVAIGYIK